jgi:aryl-alcohol dehydrogenase-like predicted oxidoreductase
MAPFTPLPAAPAPKSALGRYRQLAPSASLRVSPLCLGGMSFGTNWAELMGNCDQQATESILDAFYENGGNFIDTSNNYQFGQSEQWIGEWMKKRDVRNEMVVATKYTTNFQAGHGDPKILINFSGNGPKSLHVSVEASLKKLQTTYIDILYVHWWDYSVTIPELMQSLNHLVVTGKVLHLGISDSPAWVVPKANEYARAHGLRQFSVYQGRWSAANRDFERDIIPMCREEGMALAPWGALGSGNFKTAEQRERANHDGRTYTGTEKDIKVTDALEVVAKAKNTSVTSIAQAYVMSKAPYVFPIVGCRTVEHLKGNIEALEITLSDKDISDIEDAVSFDVGFPNNFIYGPKIPENHRAIWILAMGGTIDHMNEPKSLSRQ